MRTVSDMQDGVNDAVWIYFVVLIIVGAFFAVNLALAVLYLQFTQSQAELEVEKEQERVHQAQMPVARHSASLHNSNPDGWWAVVQDRCFELQQTFWFDATTMFLIAGNTIVMASEYHGMSDAHSRVLPLSCLVPAQSTLCVVRFKSWRPRTSIPLASQHGDVTIAGRAKAAIKTASALQANSMVNTVLTVYFTIEMAIKLVGLGVRGYLADRMNAFDGLVVIASIVEIVLSFGDRAENGALSVFRAFRLMRVFKLARRWAELNKIVRTIFMSLSSIAYLSLLLLVFIFIMALLGMQIFGYKCASCSPAHTPSSARARCCCPATAPSCAL